MRVFPLALSMLLVSCGEGFNDVPGAAQGGAAGTGADASDGSAGTSADALAESFPDAVSDSAPEAASDGHDASCAPGTGDCDGDPDNGCETDLASSTEHCGSCAAGCSTAPYATPACTQGTCELACVPQRANCDLDDANGCETDTQVSVAHCGECNHPCPNASHGTGQCQAGTCALACDAGWADCDSDGSNGCEVDLSGLSDCGACGNACGDAHGTPSCSNGTCSIQCVAGWGDCDNNNTTGCETATNVSKEHCGACGHNCLGAVCTAGKCQPELLQTLAFNATDLALSSNDVWVSTTDGSVQRVPKAGGSSVTIGSGVGSALSLAVDDKAVFWSNLGSMAKGTIASQPIGGGAVQTLATDLPYPEALALDASFVYFLDGGTGARRVRKVARTGGAPVTIVTPNDNGIDLVVDASSVFWTGGEAPGKVQRAPKAGPLPVPLATNQGYPYGIAHDGTNLFWSNEYDGNLMRIPLAGGVPTLLAAGLTYPSSIAVYGQSLCFAAQDSLWRISKTGGTPVLIANGLGSINGLAVDATHVYFVAGKALKRIVP